MHATIDVSPTAQKHAGLGRYAGEIARALDQVNDDLINTGQDLLDLVHRGEALQHAQHEPGQHRAAERTHAADHHDDEAQHQEVHAHVVVGTEDRRVHGAGQAGDDSGDAEHDGEAPVNVDTEDADGLAIGTNFIATR